MTDVGMTGGLAGTEGEQPLRPLHLIGLGGLDHDQDLDVFIANLAHPRFLSFSDKARLYINDGAEAPTTDVTEELGSASRPPAQPSPGTMTTTAIKTSTGTASMRGAEASSAATSTPRPGQVTHPTGLVVENGWEARSPTSTAPRFRQPGNKYWNAPGGAASIETPGAESRFRFGPLGAAKGHQRDGFGARINVMVDGTWRLGEGPLERGLEPIEPLTHVGLGEAESADVIVEFPASGESYSFGLLALGLYTIDEDGVLTQER